MIGFDAVRVPRFITIQHLMAIGALAVTSMAAQASVAQEQSSRQELSIAERFGIRSSVLHISLSPSGSKIAWVGSGPLHTEELNVIDLDDDEGVQTIATNTEIHADLERCDWVSEERLLCDVYGMRRRPNGLLLPFSRMFLVSSDGSNLRPIENSADRVGLRFNNDGGDLVALDVRGQTGQALITRNYVQEDVSATGMANWQSGRGVDRLDVLSGNRRRVVAPDPRASRYIADENGIVRLKVRNVFSEDGFDTGEDTLHVRIPGRTSWQDLGNIQIEGSPAVDFVPITVDAARGLIYGYETTAGFRVAVEVPLENLGAGRIIARREGVDVDRLIRVGRQRRVIGASFATEKRAVEYFDSDFERLVAALARALPDQPLINIAGASQDEQKLLIIASSDTNPGRVYIFDRQARNLEPLLEMRDYLVGQRMGQMRPVSFPAADGTQIPGYLTLPPGSDGQDLPAIVLPHGGPAARDYWGFDWLVQFFTAQGFAVLQPNFRGSTGYGEAWFGRNGYRAWDIAIGDVNSAGRWLVSEGIAQPDRLAIVGWSYGGYAALQSQVVEPNLYKAVVAIAPVTDLEYLLDGSRAFTSFRVRQEQLGRGSHIGEGSPRRHAGRFKAPVALFHGTYDANVNVRHSRAMADALGDLSKPVTYFEFEDLQHDLGDSRVRSEMLVEIGRFLDASLDL